MAGELLAVVEQMIGAFEKQDGDAAMAVTSSDVQGVDEISRRWMRGTDEMKEYFDQLAGIVTDVHSDLTDVNETITGDVGVLSSWMEQDYTMGGEKVHVSAPTTVVLRREGGQWKVTLFHSIPLSEQS